MSNMLMIHDNKELLFDLRQANPRKWESNVSTFLGDGFWHSIKSRMPVTYDTLFSIYSKSPIMSVGHIVNVNTIVAMFPNLFKSVVFTFLPAVSDE